MSVVNRGTYASRLKDLISSHWVAAARFAKVSIVLTLPLALSVCKHQLSGKKAEVILRVYRVSYI